MLFDWLVTGHVMDVNPAHSVRGPKYVVKKGKTPVLTADEARELLDHIEIVRNTVGEDSTAAEEPDLVGLRDRALIGVMVYTFARINAVINMKVRDYFVQGRRGWVRLHEKGGKEHELPCHHNLEAVPRRVHRRGRHRRRSERSPLPHPPAARPASRGRCGSRTPTA
jgi:integrase